MTDADLAEKGLNTEILHDLLSSGASKKAISEHLGISVTSLNKTIAELQRGQGLILKYKELQNLQLTALQARCLECMTPEKFECASLEELARVYKILKDKELVTDGKANNITGLVGYLVAMEKEEFNRLNPPETVYDISDATRLTAELAELNEEDDLPNL